MIRLFTTYRRFNKIIQAEYLEPAWGWGIRVGISIILPLTWGAITGNHDAAMWMAIAAECVSFIELKGNAGQRIRLLLTASLLSVLFCIAGSVAGSYFWISVLGMLVVGFLSGIFKNLGERGMALAISVYLFYILTCAYPTPLGHDLWVRTGWVAIGASLTTVIGLFSFLFIKISTPYRRTIAAVWKSVSALAHAVGKGWDGRSERSSIRETYLKEKDVRSAIDNSLYLFEETSYEVKSDQKAKYALTQCRKSASLVSLQVIQLSEIGEQLSKLRVERRLSIQFFSLMRAIEQSGERMAIYTLTLKEEERILVFSRLERLKKITGIISDISSTQKNEVSLLLSKLISISNRIIKLISRSMELLQTPGHKRVYRTYSFGHTLNILHPKYYKNNIRQLFHRNSLTTRYALRIGISAMIGWLLANLVFKDHGYWIPFTAIVVAQPYFGATLKRGIERSIGTIMGVLAGTGFLQLPFPEIARIILAFIGAVFLIYFLRRQYSVATFFLTLLLVGLLGMEPGFDAHLLQTRIICTLVGSSLAIITGFTLLPSWDKKLLPDFMINAITTNFDYFQNTFYRDEEKETNWIKWKIKAETSNSNAFDSFTRFMQEPGFKRKKGYAKHYYLITHNVRITRELNNFHNETELEDDKIAIKEKEKFIQLLYECDDLFRENISLLKKVFDKSLIDDKYSKTFPENGFINTEPNDSQYTYIEKMLIEIKAMNKNLSNYLKVNSLSL